MTIEDTKSGGEVAEQTLFPVEFLPKIITQTPILHPLIHGAGNRARTDDLLITNLMLALSTLVIFCPLVSAFVHLNKLNNSGLYCKCG